MVSYERVNFVASIEYDSNSVIVRGHFFAATELKWSSINDQRIYSSEVVSPPLISSKPFLTTPITNIYASFSTFCSLHTSINRHPVGRPLAPSQRHSSPNGSALASENVSCKNFFCPARPPNNLSVGLVYTGSQHPESFRAGRSIIFLGWAGCF